MRDWIRDFSSQIKKRSSADLFPLWERDKSENGVVIVREYAVFTQMVGKMHFLATHPAVRSDSDGRSYRIFYRGQRNFHRRFLRPFAYREGKGDHDVSNREIEQQLRAMSKIDALKSFSKNVREALLQQYGGRTRWLDAVDNIWVALWFACMRTFAEMDSETGLEFLEYRIRDPRCEVESKRYAYIHVLAVNDKDNNSRDEILDLRDELPSFYVRPHAQHAVMVRRKNGANDFADDYRDMIVATLKIPLELALAWLNDCSAMTLDVKAMFPSPYFDTGWRDLLVRQAKTKTLIFKQMICA